MIACSESAVRGRSHSLLKPEEPVDLILSRMTLLWPTRMVGSWESYFFSRSFLPPSTYLYEPPVTVMLKPV
jgi:hypothetical protein